MRLETTIPVIACIAGRYIVAQHVVIIWLYIALLQQCEVQLANKLEGTEKHDFRKEAATSTITLAISRCPQVKMRLPAHSMGRYKIFYLWTVNLMIMDMMSLKELNVTQLKCCFIPCK